MTSCFFVVFAKERKRMNSFLKKKKKRMNSFRKRKGMNSTQLNRHRIHLFFHNIAFISC